MPVNLRSDSFQDGQTAHDRLALATPAVELNVQLSENRNPHLSWDPVDGAKSYAVTCIDIDCPSAPDDVNQDDREVPASLPRVDFVHWLLADVTGTDITEGSQSDSVVAGGKPADAAPLGTHGVNDYTSWFAGDPDMGGTWHGYDGPAPPWNDSIAHRYVFTVYALDVDTAGLQPGFSRADLDAVLEEHAIDSDSMTMTYSLNPRLR
jgi:Raf kinase inhibitor-like YbhB/YbcL family protein